MIEIVNENMTIRFSTTAEAADFYKMVNRKFNPFVGGYATEEELLRLRERTAASTHWNAVERGFECFKEKMNCNNMQKYVENNLSGANKWFAGLSKRDKYALMRSSNTKSYEDCETAWAALNPLMKCYLFKDYKRKAPYTINPKFLPK